jgi:short-subunit dehydrogenase
MSTFKNKVVWITGASSGIGKALAIQLNELGAKLVLSARNKEALEKLAATCDDALVLPLDLAKPANFPALTQEVVSHFGGLDFLINNGGNSQRATADETSNEVSRQLMEINFFGPTLLTKSVLPVMKNKGTGHIIVVSSIAGKFGFYLRSSYSAAKHALHGYFDSLRLEEERNGIKVTIVCPGKIRTNMSLNALKADGSAHAKMDQTMDEGMPAEECAAQIISAAQANKEEVLIGGKEILAAKIKRFSPKLFGKIIRKQSPF